MIILRSILVWMLVLSEIEAYPRLGAIPERKIDSITLAQLLTPMAGEPSCEDLRLMWRFSRRQNRVAEITNEIPGFRDPFAINVWEEIQRPKPIIMGTLRSGGGRSWHRPVYGRLVQSAPRGHPRLNYQELLRYLGDLNPNSMRGKGPVSAFRLTGGMHRPNPLNQIGSFQHLKELIWEERAKELQDQRIMEEAAARNLALKDVKIPVQYNRGFGYGGRHLYRERLPVNGEIRYFDEDYVPLNRYQPPKFPFRKTYRYSPVSNDEKLRRW